MHIFWSKPLVLAFRLRAKVDLTHCTRFFVRRFIVTILCFFVLLMPPILLTNKDFLTLDLKNSWRCCCCCWWCWCWLPGCWGGSRDVHLADSRPDQRASSTDQRGHQRSDQHRRDHWGNSSRPRSSTWPRETGQQRQVRLCQLISLFTD